MKKTLFFVACLGALLLLFGIASPALGENYDPIYISASCSPKSISGPQEVTVTIVVTNQADAELSVPIALYDPAKNQVQFSGGVTSISMGQKATYTGKWTVTADELAAGKIIYRLSYNQLDENRNPVGYSKAFSIPVKKSASSAQLSASYSISPSTASKGQTVTLTYTVTNTGNTNLIDLTITNNNLSKEHKTFISRLEPGEKVTRTIDYTMGSKAIKSKPKITYKVEGSKEVLTYDKLGEKTIELEKGGVTVNLKAKGKTEVEPGEKVELTITITNSSNVGYTDVKISDPTLGEIATGKELKANGGKITETKTITVSETADYTFKVTGTGGSGKELDLSSNVVSVVAIDMSKRLQLGVSATAQSTEIYSEPAEVVFEITVKNTGESAGKDMVLKHGKTTIATIGTMEPGEERVYVKRILVSMGGKFKFSVTGINAQGVEQTIEMADGTEVYVPYLEPTPEPPPPTREPTPPPAEEDEEEATQIPAAGGTKGDTGGSGSGMLLLWILAGALMLALLAVIARIFIGRRRQALDEAQADSAIDSLQRGTRRDYSSAHRPTHAQQRVSRDAEQGAIDPGVEDAAEAFGEAGLAGTASIHELAAMYGKPEHEESAGESKKRGRESAAKSRRTTEDTANAYLARMREPDGDVDSTSGEPASQEGGTDYHRRRRARSVDA